jgi:hypothetical protein
VVGYAAVRAFFLYAVFPSEQCSFSSISNVEVSIDGDHASGADYFVHWGYNNPRFPANTRHHVEGQHYYEFKKENGSWKSRMLGRPTFRPRRRSGGVRRCRRVSCHGLDRRRLRRAAAGGPQAAGRA